MQSSFPIPDYTDNTKPMALTEDMVHKMQLLEMQGFTRTPEMLATLHLKYPADPINKYRTQCFANE
jgi:hypothetical protein